MRQVPLDRLLIETDAPYLAPVPHRGTRNEPALVALTAAAVARERGLSVEELVAAVTCNYDRLLGDDRPQIAPPQALSADAPR